PELGDLAFDLDVEIVDRDAEARVPEEVELRREHTADDPCSRGFRLEHAEAALGYGGRGNARCRMVGRNAVGRAVVGDTLRDAPGGEFGAPLAARIDRALRREARLVSKELFEQGRSAERGAVAAAE